MEYKCMAILITGASGFVGSRLAAKFSENSDVICFSRSKPEFDLPFVQGSFDNYEDLVKLDSYKITSVVHLAGVVGGCSEEDGFAVNIQGSRRLIRYLLDKHNCRKFVMASSIATVGCLDASFLPEEFPIKDEHPCHATDAYGMSKAIAEDISKFYSRIYPDADFTHLRLACVQNDNTWFPKPIMSLEELSCPITNLSCVMVSDAIDAFIKAWEHPHTPGMRIYNVVGPDSACDKPVIEMLYSIYGKEAMDRYDLSFYRKEGNEFKPLFSIDKIGSELGFEAKRNTAPNLDK
jgi:nucleoside-diphosphate-sugar epimerase